MMFSVAAYISIVFLPSLEFATVNEFFFFLSKLRIDLPEKTLKDCNYFF